jgi:hypothetical protein
MSYWGTIEDRDGNRHIVPCTEDGTVLGGHIADIGCLVCPPRKDRDSKGIIYVHDDPQRGGGKHGDTN